MRIKVVADIHGAADDLRREASDADVLLVCGDLVNLLDYRTMHGIIVDVYGLEPVREFVELRTAGQFAEAAAVLRAHAVGRQDELRERVRRGCRAEYEAVFAAFPAGTYLTHGNVDTPDLFTDLLRPGVRHLDGEVVQIDGMRVGFVGGGLPRGPRAVLAEETEEAFGAKVRRLPAADVLCTHVPPAVEDLCFDVVAGRPEPGSPALLAYIEEHQPEYAYFGHVHQPRRQRLRIGRTQLVNVGYFRGTGRMHLHGDDRGHPTEWRR